MSRIVLLSIICLLLCSCSGHEGENFETEIASVTASGDTASEAISAETAKINTVSVISETKAAMNTELSFDDMVLTPIASDKSYDAMECGIFNVYMTEYEFRNKDILTFAKEICFADEFVQQEIERYNTQPNTKNKIVSADDIELISSGYSDFDIDGKREYLLLLKYTGWDGYGGGFLIYIDGDNYTILEKDTNKDVKVKIIESNSYSFMMTETTQSASSYQNNIYSFESGMPEKVFDIQGASHTYRYENGVFYCEVKNDDMVYPFALCTDGVFRQLACEEISPEDFEVYVNRGKEYLDLLAKNGDDINKIYTYGYYSYRLSGNDCCYILTEAKNISGVSELHESRYQLSDDLPAGYTPFEFTEKLIYGADVHAVREISFLNRDIGGGYSIYAVNKDEYTAVLYVADEKSVTDSMEISSADLKYLCDRYSFYPSYTQFGFYDFDAPPCFALPRTGWGLTYDTYFIVDGRICQGEWHLDGEKLDGLDYTMLCCFGNGDNEFVSYSAEYYNEPLTKRYFTIDREKLIFEGYSEPYTEPTGYAAIAADVFKKHSEFVGGLFSYDGSYFGEWLDEDSYYSKYEKEGFRTKEEVMDTLQKYCTKSMAEQFCSYYIWETGDVTEYNGCIYRSTSAPSHYESLKYIDSAEKKDGIITARVYSYTIGQDIPYDIEPPMYAEIVQEDGIWKLASLDFPA